MFRDRFLDYASLTDLLQQWAADHPEICHLQSLGQTPEGREIWCLTLGTDPDRIRPAAWVNANQHANELTGTNVALGIAARVIRAHTQPVDDPIEDVLRELLVYVAPRVSPDGAEAILTTGRYVRSVPRDSRPGEAARWEAADIDGDGLALLMRLEDPTGEFVESTEVPDLLVPREVGDRPPFYKIYPEGQILGFDGTNVPSPSFLSDNYPDLNRNWPFDWAPEHRQQGAGAFPGSEPETEAVIRFASTHPNIVYWLDLHTFGGVHIRPLGDQPDNKMEPYDRAVYRQLEQWADELTSYPMVSGFEEFTYAPDTPLHGDLSEYGYRQRGAVAYVTELWDLFAQVGFPRPERFVDHYTHLDRVDLERLARWDADHNKGRCLQPWRPFVHSQLGEVELGGLDPRFGFWNPPPERLDEVISAQVSMWSRVAAMAPQLVLETATHPLGPGFTRLTITVENRGYLPTYVLDGAKDLDIAEPIRLEVRGDAIIEGPARQELGHLAGWGTGRYSGVGALYFARSPGSHGRAVRTYVIKGSGTVHVRAGSCRMGHQTRVVELP